MRRKLRGICTSILSMVLVLQLFTAPVSGLSFEEAGVAGAGTQEADTPKTSKVDEADIITADDPFAALEQEALPAQAGGDLLQPAKTDRYIVKYKSPESAAGVQEKLRQNDIDTEAFADDGQENMRAQSSPSSVASMEAMELVLLDKPIAPSEFAEELSGLGIRDDIEYIQPDYLLKLSSLESEIPEEDAPDSSEEQAPAPEDSSAEEVPESGGDSGSIPPQEADDSSIVEPETTEPEEPLPEQTSGAPVIVAMLDTGVDTTHPALRPYVTGGWDFTSDSDEVYSDEKPNEANHGTHVAGIIADTLKAYGASARIMPLKVFAGGKAYTSDIIAAIEYAAANGAQIISCSFGSTTANPALEEAISGTNALFVCAVGNSRTDLADTPVYPACYELPNILSVASVNADDGFSYFSNYGAGAVDLSALGRDVVSCLPENSSGPMTGTSMSAAWVAAAAAAVLSNGAMDTEDLHGRLVTSADQLSNLEQKVTGARRLNIQNALDGVVVDEIAPCTPQDDFDVHGHQRTVSEDWELFSSSDFVKIESSSTHTLALKSDGTVWAWGDNSFNQLGTGDNVSSLTPIQVPGLTGIVDIAAGSGLESEFGGSDGYFDGSIEYGNYSLAVKSNGTVYFWGYFFDEMHEPYFSMTDYLTWQSNVPEQVYELSNIKSVSGGKNMFALSKAGALYMYGMAQAHEDWYTGDYLATYFWSFESVATGIKKVDTSGPYTVIQKTDNTVLNRYMAQVSGGIWYNDGAAGAIFAVPGLTGVADVAAGGGGANYGNTYEHGLAVKTDGTIRAWGFNNRGQLGRGSLSPSSTVTPAQITSLSGISAVSAGAYHSLGLKTNGTVAAWGSNSHGQIGTGQTAASVTSPTIVPGLSGIVYVSAGANSSFAMDQNGNVWAWGDNTYGQLGDGTTTSRNTPVLIYGDGNGVTSIMKQIACKTDDFVSVPIAVLNAPNKNSLVFTVSFNSLDFEIYDLCESTAALDRSTGSVPGASLNVLSVDDDGITFKYTGTSTSGLVNTVKLRAKRTGILTVDCSAY